MVEIKRIAKGIYESPNFGIYYKDKIIRRKAWKIRPLTFPGTVIFPAKPSTPLSLKEAQAAVNVYESWAAAWILGHCKHVTWKDVSNVAMVAGKERQYPTVIVDDRVKDWVAIGWVDLRKATEKDYDMYPIVID
jgi:hypothetical protein